MLRKIVLSIAGLLVIAGIVYLVGPKPPQAVLSADLPSVPDSLKALSEYVQQKELSVKNIKPDNEARIIWADSLHPQKTPYSIVYIHGFGATWAEGEPVHRNLAKRYGANLYVARLKGAGVDDPDTFEDLTPQNFVEGAKEALAIGKKLGDKVLLIGTSAGGLLSVYLASTHPEISALVLYSPCMDIYGSALKVATGPWGAQAVDKIIGKRMINDYSPERAKYWSPSYSSKGLITLQQSMDAIAVPEVYSRIKMPVFLGYYYKNDDEQDKTVSVSAMQEMFPLLGTPSSKKVEKAFPESGHHVIASKLTSSDWKGVQAETEKFLDTIVGVPVINPN